MGRLEKLREKKKDTLYKNFDATKKHNEKNDPTWIFKPPPPPRVVEDRLSPRKVGSVRVGCDA